MGRINTAKRFSRKNRYAMIAAIAVLCVALVATFFYLRTRDNVFSSATAVACTVTQYSTDENGQGYATLSFNDEVNGDERTKTLPVSEEAAEQIHDRGSDGVIGAHIFLDIPNQWLRKKHLDLDSLTKQDLLFNTAIPDSFFSIADFSFSDAT